MRRTVAMAMDGTCLGRTLWMSSATTRPARWRVFKQLAAAAAGRLVGFASWLAGWLSSARGGKRLRHVAL